MNVDVLVVGAGPSGSTAARVCAAQGMKVALVDKAVFPRDKPCGGGVNVRAARLLPFDLQSVTEREACGVEVHCGGAAGLVRRADEPLTFMVQRRMFDALLVERAIDEGARFYPGAPLKSVERQGEQFVAEAGGERFHCRVLIAADGVYGKTATLAGVHEQHRHAIAMEVAVPISAAGKGLALDTIFIEVDRVRCGYAWRFAKRDHFNVGVGLYKEDARLLRPWLEAFAASQGIDVRDLRGIRSHWLPIRRRGAPLVAGNLMLVGDAAGLVDPFSGEGIYQAIYSGDRAAKHAGAYLRGEAPSLEGYAWEIQAYLGAELESGLALHRLMHSCGGLLLPVLACWDAPWKNGFRILQGKSDFREFDRSLGPVVRAARAFVQWYGERSERRKGTAVALGG